MRCCQIRHNFKHIEYLCKLCKEYFTSLTSKFYTFFRQNMETFDISHTFLSLTVTKLLTLKAVSFLAHPVVCCTVPS